jgi:hypothetical protein
MNVTYKSGFKKEQLCDNNFLAISKSPYQHENIKGVIPTKKKGKKNYLFIIICVFIYLFIYLFIYFYLFIFYLFIYLFIYLPVSLSCASGFNPLCLNSLIKGQTTSTP